MSDFQTSLRGALDIQPGGPGNPRFNVECAGLDGISEDLGGVTGVKCLDPTNFNKRKTVFSIRSAPGDPTTSVTVRFQVGMWLQDFICEFGLYARHACKGVRNDVSEYAQLEYMGGCNITARNTDPLVDIAGEETEINLTAPITGEYVLYLNKTKAERVFAGLTDLDAALNDVFYCDTEGCGDCGDEASDGCQKWFAVGADRGAGYIPGENPIVLMYDGTLSGTKYLITEVTNLLGDANFGFCLGSKLFVVSSAIFSFAYAEIADLWAGVADPWTIVADQFVVGGEPNDYYSHGREIWVVGDGGYIYYSADGGITYEIMSDGDITSEDLVSIDSSDNDNIFIVGTAGTVLISTNGGETWASSVFAVGITPTVVKAPRANYAYIGATDGNLYWTRDLGLNWQTLSVGGSGQVKDLVFTGAIDGPIAFLLFNKTAGTSVILRSIDGGYSFDEMIDVPSSIDNYLNSIDACNGNRFVAVGELAGVPADYSAVVEGTSV